MEDMTAIKETSEGFKETEIGVLPEDWGARKVSQLFEIQQGKALAQKHKKGISPHPFLRTANVFWGRVDLTNVDWMDFTSGEIDKLALRGGDLLVCEGGDIGRTAIWRGQIERCCYQNHLHRLRPKDSDAFPLFYMFWMQASILLLGLYVGTGNKTTIPNLSRGRLSEYLLPLPPFREQQKIASVLSAVQEAKEKTENVLSALKELKKSMMKHLFTYGAVSVEEVEKVPLKETEIGMIPEHWEVRKLSTLFEFSKKPRTLQIKEDDIVPFIPMELLSEENISIKGYQLKKMSEISSGTFVFKNDLIIAKITPSFENGKQAILNNLPNEFGYATTEVWALHPKDILGATDFIYNYIRISDIRHSLASKMEGATGRQRLPRNVLENLTLPIPPIAEQHQIAEILSAIDDKINAEQTKKTALDALFKTLLSLLMTGKIRVKDIYI